MKMWVEEIGQAVWTSYCLALGLLWGLEIYGDFPICVIKVEEVRKELYLSA